MLEKSSAEIWLTTVPLASLLSSSRCTGETRAAGLHNSTQPRSSLNPLISSNCVFRKRGDVQIRPRDESWAWFSEDTDPLPEAVSANRPRDSLVHVSHQTRTTHIPCEQIRNVKTCRPDDVVCPAVQSTASSDMPPEWSELILP